jgi:hypothetical protein
MHLSRLGILISVAALLVAASLVWLLVVVFRREQYTRERFAFVALTSLSALGASVVAALAHNESIWQIVADLIRDFRGVHTSPEPAHVSDHVLMIVAFTLILFAIVRIYEGWDGAVSERQFEKQRYHEPSPLIKEGLHEAKRVLTREPAPALHVPLRHSYQSALEGPQDTLAWHIHARDLICLRSPGFEVDRDLGWHHEARCWIGINKRSLDVVAIRCETQEIDDASVAEFVGYVKRVGPTAVVGKGAGFELILAIRNSTDTGIKLVGSEAVRKESERTLLDELVDFSDYYADISYRAERQPLPDSGQTLSQVYTPPSSVDERGNPHDDVESYLQSWLLEPGQRQLALLGEYGQGKSTTALMFAHKLISQPNQQKRIPILIELRGKSPRNMSVEDILAAWAFPYRIDPLAVMKLLVAGRIFLILEGFDEMALVGDSEARLSHFRTLWGFCYPKAKILITGRPNFFLDDNEMRAALGISRSAAAGPYCEALHLKPFSLQQIQLALRATPAAARGEILELARKEPKFCEIVARGSLLYLVSQLWERERLSQFKGQINSAFVIDLFIQHSYRRQSSKTAQAGEFMVLNESERKYFMDGIAAYMGALGLPNQIPRDDFEKAVKRLYEVIPEEVSSGRGGLPKSPQKPLRRRLADVEDAATDVANDVRSGGILVVDPSKSGALRFAHKSFMEFLIASVYADRVLGVNRGSNSALLVTSRLGAEHLAKESLKFLAELLVFNLRANDDERYFRRPMSVRLFDIIVVRRYGGGLRGQLLARAALAECRYVSAVYQMGLGRFGSWVSLLYPRRLALLAFSFVGICFFSIQILLIEKGLTPFAERSIKLFMIGIMLPIMTVFLMHSFSRRVARSPRDTLRSGFGESAIRLWFTCCILAKLSPNDIAHVVGSDRVVPLLSYFELEREVLHEVLRKVVHQRSAERLEKSRSRLNRVMKAEREERKNE